MFYSWLTSLWFLLFYSPKPWCQVWILIYRNWSIFQAYQFKGAVCLKGLFFVDFRPFFLNNYNVARISLEIKKWLHVLSWSPMVQYLCENFEDDFPNVFNVRKWKRGCLKSWKNWKILDLGAVKIWKKNRISCRKISDSPPLQQAAFDLISELTGLNCSYFSIP